MSSNNTNNSDEQEYRIPVKVLTNRDPIIAGKLSLREMGQWVVALVLLYIVLNLMPGPFQIKAILAAILIMGAVVFIHIPINGLAGIEWVFINFRYRAEKRLHSSTGSTMTPDSVLLAATRPTFAFTTAQTATNNNPFNSETEISGFEAIPTAAAAASTASNDETNPENETYQYGSIVVEVEEI